MHQSSAVYIMPEHNSRNKGFPYKLYIDIERLCYKVESVTLTKEEIMSTVIKSAAEGVARPIEEANDCTVRALANAAGMPYSIADRVLSAAGRRSKKRCGIDAMHSAYKRMGLKLQAIFGNDKTARFLKNRIAPDAVMQQGITLEKQLQKLTHGRYIVMVYGHVFAVVDGKVLDYGHNRAGSRVQAVYKLEQQAVIFDK